MGKGDKKTRRGKTQAGSYGNVRKHSVAKVVAKKAASSAVPKKAAVRKRPA